MRAAAAASFVAANWSVNADTQAVVSATPTRSLGAGYLLR